MRRLAIAFTIAAPVALFGLGSNASGVEVPTPEVPPAPVTPPVGADQTGEVCGAIDEAQAAATQIPDATLQAAVQDALGQIEDALCGDGGGGDPTQPLKDQVCPVLDTATGEAAGNGVPGEAVDALKTVSGQLGCPAPPPDPPVGDDPGDDPDDETGGDGGAGGNAGNAGGATGGTGSGGGSSGDGSAPGVLGGGLALPSAGTELPRTGGEVPGLVGLAVTGLALALRRMFPTPVE